MPETVAVLFRGVDRAPRNGLIEWSNAHQKGCFFKVAWVCSACLDCQ